MPSLEFNGLYSMHTEFVPVQPHEMQWSLIESSKFQNVDTYFELQQRRFMEFLEAKLDRNDKITNAYDAALSSQTKKAKKRLEKLKQRLRTNDDVEEKLQEMN